MKKFAALVLFVAITAPCFAKQTDTLTLAGLRQQRRAVAGKQRRIIFNNDGNEPFRYVKELTAKGLLAPRTLGLENTQVDAIYYCTSHSWGNFSHSTKIGSVLTVKEDPKTATLFKNNLTGELIAAGLDPLKVMVDFGHQHHKEVFWSMRMNDTHDGGKDTYGPVLFHANRIKMAHPEYLVGTQFEKGKGSWSAANYGLKEVRDLTFRFIEEVCTNYDVDGIELDFFRHRTFFKSTFKGNNASAEEIAEMTELIRRIRTMTEEVGLKRHRPILVSMRLPDSKDYARALGLDMETWLKEGLLDIMTVSGYVRLNPWEYSVALGHKYGVKVYPDIEDSRVDDKEGAALRNSPASFRAQALEAWMAGADGVYMFNFFDPKSSLWNEMGDAKKLIDLDRDHFASVRGEGKVSAVDHKNYVHVPTLNPGAPLAVGRDGIISNILFWPGAKGYTRLRLKFKGDADPKNITVKINGHMLTGLQLHDGWLDAAVKAADLQNGANAVFIGPATNYTGELVLTDMEMQYRNKPF